MRFIRNDMKITDGGFGHKGIITHKGVFWGCGGCGTKNSMGSECCVTCRLPNYRVATPPPAQMPSFVPRIL